MKRNARNVIMCSTLVSLVVVDAAARADTSTLTSTVVKYTLSTSSSSYSDVSQVALNLSVTNIGAIPLYFAHDNEVCVEMHAVLVDAAGNVVPPSSAPNCRTFAYGSYSFIRPFDPGQTKTVFDSRRGSDASGSQLQPSRLATAVRA